MLLLSYNYQQRLVEGKLGLGQPLDLEQLKLKYKQILHDNKRITTSDPSISRMRQAQSLREE